jgi:hypothetical protein
METRLLAFGSLTLASAYQADKPTRRWAANSKSFKQEKEYENIS